ncbi:MAG: alcohol dehydrogenase catalytic domain-containing protein, partial [Chloroflexi bacterium]|nr:alcohol dehydrogenase catalytic domain-containing protein [Chloroflexota bacterium]
MRALVLNATWDPQPNYTVSEWEKQTGKAITGSSVWRYPKLEVRDWPDPTPGPKEVVLEVRACGVCGSDVHFYETDQEGYILYPGLTKFPTILGHEFSGRVVACGPEVEMLQVGDMVTAEEMIWCGRCIPCRNGYPNQCENLEEIGFTIPGAFAKYIVLDEKYCWKIDAIAERLGDEEAAYDLGALTEPTCVAYNAMFERAHGFRPGHYVAVFGAGPIGLAATGLARAAGAGLVVAFDVSPSRLELAQKVGADYTYNPREVNPAEVLMTLSKGAGFDF